MTQRLATGKPVLYVKRQRGPRPKYSPTLLRVLRCLALGGTLRLTERDYAFADDERLTSAESFLEHERRFVLPATVHKLAREGLIVAISHERIGYKTLNRSLGADTTDYGITSAGRDVLVKAGAEWAIGRWLNGESE